MKRLLVFCCLSLTLNSCQNNPKLNSDTKAYASDLSDQSGKLSKTFLYLSEADNVIQRECQVAAPRGLADCPTVRSRQSLTQFRSAVEADILLSRSRLMTSLDNFRRDRKQIVARKAEHERALSDLKNQLNRLPPALPASESVQDPFTLRALNFAKGQRESVKARLAASTDPAMQTQLQEALKQFDFKIAELEAKLGGTDPNAATRLELQRNIVAAESALATSHADLVGLDRKMFSTEAAHDLVAQEFLMRDSVIDQLKQTVVFDARADSASLPTAEKQLVSRFHKLFTVTTPACKDPVIDPLKELAIGSPAVYASKESQVGGIMSFGEVLKPMLGNNPSPKQVETFIREWVKHWSNEFKTSNGDRAAARPGFTQVIDQWRNASSARGIDGLDLRLAPFRLIGITNRFDLRNPLIPGDAGESRLVFALLDSPTDRPQDEGHSVKPFSLIFEFQVATASDSELPRWLKLWHELSGIECSVGNCQDYAKKLANIVKMVTRNEGGIIRSSLGQVRSNEIAFGNPWELREFQLKKNGGESRLIQVDTKQTPQQSLNASQELASFVDSLSIDSLLKNKYEIPLAMRSAKAQVLNANPEWQIPVAGEKAKLFNLNTCNGCHSNDQEVIDGFYHISPFQKPGVDAMSDFMKKSDLPRRALVVKPFLISAECSAGTIFDARMASESNRMLARPVH